MPSPIDCLQDVRGNRLDFHVDEDEPVLVVQMNEVL